MIYVTHTFGTTALRLHLQKWRDYIWCTYLRWWTLSAKFKWFWWYLSTV